MIKVAQVEYDYPKSIHGGFFNNPSLGIPTFQNWQRNHHIYFLRYLHYLLNQSWSTYPCTPTKGIPYPLIQKEITDLEVKIGKLIDSENGNRPIKKILIGEAPPAGTDYFYNPIKWPSISPWINRLAKCMLLSGHVIKNKVDFLVACAKEGFLLLDLFPYAISYVGKRNSLKYKNACFSAFRNGTGFYNINIINTLDQLKDSRNINFAIGFGMKKSGEAILKDKNGCVADFSKIILTKPFKLNPRGSIDKLRTLPTPSIKNPSKYLRVVADGSGNPNLTLLQHAGFC